MPISCKIAPWAWSAAGDRAIAGPPPEALPYRDFVLDQPPGAPLLLSPPPMPCGPSRPRTSPGGWRGFQALSRPQAIDDWLAALRQTDYIVVTEGLTPQRIPWGPALLGYLYGHFREAGVQPGLVVWARRPS